LEAVKKFVVIAFAGIMLFGCKSDELVFDDIQVPDISSTRVFPLGEVRYSMRDLIDNIGDAELDLEEDSATSVLTLFYRDTILYNGTDDFVIINDIVQNITINNIPAAGPFPIDTLIDISRQINIYFNATGSDQLDSLFYAGGDLALSMTLSVDKPTEITTSLLSTVLLSTGNPLSLYVNSPTGNGTTTDNVDLANHKTTLTTDSMTIDVNGQITLQAGESLTGMEEINIGVSYSNQVFQSIFGRFGHDTIQVGNQQVDIEFFREMGEQGIFFGNPKMRFDFRNSFGIPMAINLSRVFGDDANGGSKTFLTGDIVTNPPRIEGSDVTDVGSVAQSTFEISKLNSSLVDLLSTSPGRLIFDIGAFTNPLDPTQVNYLQPTSAIDAYIEMEIPMEIRLDNLEQSGTLSLGGGIDISNIDSVFMRITTINGLPFSGLLSLEIQDADSNALYSVTDQLVIKAPFINVNGFVTDPGGATTDIPFGPDGLEALKVGSHVLFTLTLNTPESVTSRDIFVKLIADYTIEIKIGLGGKLTVKL
jgi:hypothetical protein